MRDRIYSAPGGDLVDFVFDERVARVFPDMIRRSVPGYELIVAMTGLFAARHAQPDGRCYDLGCSLGATSLSMQKQVRTAGVQIVGVDSAPAMIAEAQRLAGPTPEGMPPIAFLCADVRTAPLDAACVVAMNFTLQFVPPGDRAALLARVHGALHPKGALLIAEKVVSTAPFDAATHLDFKRANGYSELEIAQKRSALDEVLVPDSVEQHIARLRTAGFTWIYPWFRCLNWCAIIATP